jgi:hypothetical protein
MDFGSWTGHQQRAWCLTNINTYGEYCLAGDGSSCRTALDAAGCTNYSIADSPWVCPDLTGGACACPTGGAWNWIRSL